MTPPRYRYFLRKASGVGPPPPPVTRGVSALLYYFLRPAATPPPPSPTTRGIPSLLYFFLHRERPAAASAPGAPPYLFFFLQHPHQGFGPTRFASAVRSFPGKPDPHRARAKNI